MIGWSDGDKSLLVTLTLPAPVSRLCEGQGSLNCGRNQSMGDHSDNNCNLQDVCLG